MQEVFDRLYADSKNGNNFYKLYEIITSKQNIRLAYRNIKTNSGSTTAGVDGKTIKDIKKCSEQYVIQKIRNKLNNYQLSQSKECTFQSRAVIKPDRLEYLLSGTD